MPRHEELYDLYPDAPAALDALRAAVCGRARGQPAGGRGGVARRPVLAAGDLVATSAAWGLCKPDPAFFARIAGELALPPQRVAYVGDRVDFDVLPAAEARHVHRPPPPRPLGRDPAAWPEAATADATAANLDEAVTAILAT